ncbi:MAG: hypothetical protein HDT27_04690 [Subdoligranulum sp.]|nr:hypothetical protein [Subdoligranulum sp.]
MCNYKVYKGSFSPKCFVGTFRSTEEHEYTLPELEEMLDIKDLIVLPETVHNEFVVAIGK